MMERRCTYTAAQAVAAEEAAAHPKAVDPCTVTIVEHARGFLMRIEHDGASMVLDRAEAFDLHEQLNAKLGGMPVKL
jgi:hypothetical protein